MTKSQRRWSRSGFSRDVLSSKFSWYIFSVRLRNPIVVYDCSSWGMWYCFKGTIPVFDSLTKAAVRPEGSSELIKYIRMNNRVRQSYGVNGDALRDIRFSGIKLHFVFSCHVRWQIHLIQRATNNKTYFYQAKHLFFRPKFDMNIIQRLISRF